MSKLTKKDSLMLAIQRGQAEVVDRKLKSDDELHADLEADSARNCLLHRAARYGHVEVIKVLLSHNADPLKKNKFGMTCLHHAAVAGDAEVILILLSAKGQGQSLAKVADDAGRTPLHWAAGNGFFEACRVLVEKGGAKGGVADREGWTPLHRCCQEKPPPMKKKKKDEEEEEEEIEIDPQEVIINEDKERAKIAKLLLSTGANPNVTEPKGNQSCLHLCAMNGYASTAKVLIQEGGAKLNVQNKISQTPLMYACIERHARVIAVLLDNGASLDVKNKLNWDWTALHWAVLQDDPDIVQLILKYADKEDKEAKDKMGRTPLELAREHEKTRVIRVLRS